MNPNTNQSTPPLTIPPEVYKFLESILEDAKMTMLDEDMKREMINELFVRLDAHITSVIVDKLPKEHLEPFIKMSEEKKSQAEIEQYLKDKLPNAQEIMVNAFADFRSSYLASVTQTKGSYAN